MGYACPVCEAPQADGEHLANHLAFSAMLGHDDHADWLDESVPDWGDDDPEELADRVTPLCEEMEYPQVFDDTTGERPDVDVPTQEHDHAHRAAGAQPSPDPGHLDQEAREILDEARRMTEQRRDEDGDDE